MKPDVIQKETENQLKESFDRIFVGEMVKNDRERYDSLKSLSDNISGDIKLCLNKINTDLPFKKDIGAITDKMEDLITGLPSKTDINNISGSFQSLKVSINEQHTSTQNDISGIISTFDNFKLEISDIKNSIKSFKFTVLILLSVIVVLVGLLLMKIF